MTGALVTSALVGLLTTGASTLPFNDSTCWQEAASIVKTLRTIQGVEDLKEITPDQSSACKLFDYNHRRVIALTLLQCQLNERHGRLNERHGRMLNERDGLPTRDTLSASELSSITETESDTVNEPLASLSSTCLDLKSITQTDFDADIERQIIACFKTMDDYMYHLFVEHMNHIENLCFHVHSAIWQQSTQNLLQNLSKSAADVTEQLKESSIKFGEMSTKQDASLRLQDKILRNGENLHQIVESGNHRVQDAFDHMRTQVEAEHQKVVNLFSEIFQGVDKLISFQQFLKTKVLDVQAVAVYGFMIFLTYHMTSGVRTQNARAPLISIWTGGLVLELFAARFLNNEDIEYQKKTLILICRYGFALIGLTIWIKCYIQYEDPYSRKLDDVHSHIYVLEHKIDRCLRRSSTMPTAIDTAVVRRTRKDS